MRLFYIVSMAQKRSIIKSDASTTDDGVSLEQPIVDNWTLDEGVGAKQNAAVKLIMEDLTEGDEKKRTTVQLQPKKSLIRAYQKRFKRMQAKVHPLDRPVSPQILLTDGKFEVWNPGLKFSDNGCEDNEIKTQNIFNCCSFKSHAKWSGTSDFLFNGKIKKIEVGFGSGVASVFQFIRWVVLHNFVLFFIWGAFLMIPTSIGFDYSVLENTTFKFENIIDGNGPLQHLWLFYGAYPPNQHKYRIDIAYILVALVSYFGTLFMLLRSIAKTEARVKGSTLSLLLFTSFNFSLHTPSDQEALRSDTSIQAKDALSEVKAKEEARSKVRRGIWLLILRRMFAWTISIALTVAACVIIYIFLTEVTVAELIASKTNVKIGRGFLKNNGLSLVFSLINLIFPAIISKLVKIEGYAKVTTEIRINVVRVFSLRFLSIVVLMGTLYSTVTSESFIGCGGTFIGQEFYKIIVFDMFIVQLIRFAIKGVIGLIRKEKKQPDISGIILQVVYRQALIWSGTFFCPAISLLGLFSQIIVFMSNFLLVSKFCKAPSKRFRNEGTTSFYKSCMVVTLGILLVPAVTVLGSKYVSIGNLRTLHSVNTTCGPFKDKAPLLVLKEISDNKKSMPDWLHKSFDWLTSAAVFPAFIVLSTIIYVQTVRLKRQARSYKELQIDHNKFKAKTNARLVRVITNL